MQIVNFGIFWEFRRFPKGVSCVGGFEWFPTLPLPAPVCHAPTKLTSHKPHPPPPPYTTDALGTPVPPPRQQADHTRPFDTFFILPAYILLIIDGYGELGGGDMVEGLVVVLCEAQ